MNKFSTSVTFLLIAIFTCLIVVIPAVGAETGAVTASVTPYLVSVSLSPGQVNYGIKQLSGSGNPDSEIVATNNGTVNETFNIKGDDTVPTSGSGGWALSSSPRANTYVHSYGLSPNYTYVNLTKPYATMVSPIAVNGTKTFRLHIQMPTSTTNYSIHTTTVTVQAVYQP